MKITVTSMLKSPILHFFVLGSVAFVAYTQLKPLDRETIKVTAQTIDALVQQRESITQNPLTSEERKELIQGHIEDEILLREAYKRGFDKNDFRVRKRLLRLMRSSLSDVIPEPSVTQLRAYYEENKKQYLTSPSRSFEQVFFSFTSTKLPEKPDQFINQLREAKDPAELGEFSMLGNTFTKASFQSIAASFGKPFAQVVFDMPLGKWQGPVESFRGIHYVLVSKEHEPELPPFEKMESYLRQDYLMRKMRDSQQQKIDELGRNYDVVVEGK